MEMMLSWLDNAVFAAMLVLSTLIGIYFAYFAPGGNLSAAEYLVGGRSMGTLPIALSLIASYISGITLLGYPAEVYVYGMQVAYKMLALPFMGFFFAYQLLPVFRDLSGISLYAYFARRFNNNVRLLASCLFVIGNRCRRFAYHLYCTVGVYHIAAAAYHAGTMCWLPIVIFVPALAYEQVAGVNIHWVTPMVCIVCIYYTTVGGIKAVVWTDAVQAVSMFGCVSLVIVMGMLRVGGFNVVWERNVDGGRLEAPVLDVDPTTRHTFFTMLVGAFIGHCAHAGLSQSMIQRYLALPSNRSAITAMWIFIAGICVFFITSVTAGLIIYAYHHDCDPVSAKMVTRKDQLLPLFVMETLSGIPCLPGLFISGVFSAALSSMSTSLNSMSAVILEDWVRGYGGYEPSERLAAWIMRGAVVVLGFATVALVFVVEHLGMVMQMSASMAAVSTGPLFTLFMVGLFLPWCDTRSALTGALSSAVFTATIVFGAQWEIAAGRLRFPIKPVSVDGCEERFNLTDTIAAHSPLPTDSSEVFYLFRISYLWYVPMSLLVGLLAAGLAALLGWRSDLRLVEPHLLAPMARRLLPAAPRPAAPAATCAAEQALLLADLRLSLQNVEKQGKESHRTCCILDEPSR